MRLLIGCGVGFLVSVVAVWARLRWVQRAAVVDAARIRPVAYRWTGVDEPARRRSELRRLEAERKQRDAGRIRTRDDGASRIHRAV